MNTVTAETLSPITHNQIPVITTELLAQLYGADVKNIQNNYARNVDRFVAGKHFFKVEGEALREMKHRPSLSRSVKIARNVRSLILWTERGAARHAKMLETDQAWEVFEKLEDCYFSRKSPVKVPAPVTKQFTDNELCTLVWLWRAGDVMLSACQDVTLLLQVAEHPKAGRFTSIGLEYPRILHRARDILARETAHIKFQPWQEDNWSRVLPHLRQDRLL